MQVRQRGPAKTAGKVHLVVTALVGIDPALDRRRRRGENDGKIADPAAHHRHVSGIVEHPVLLLVGRIVLLVDDDQAEILERQEQRRARAGDDMDVTFRHLPPDLFTHARCEIRMPLAGLGAETVLETFKKSRRQGDFRQENQHLPALT